MKPKTQKYFMYAGGALAVLVGSAVTYKYLIKPKMQPLGFVFPFTDEAKVYDAATAQVNRAMGGQALSDYRQAEDLSLFWGGAPTDPIAYAKAAYWVAVAARVSSSQSLATYSRQLMDEANRFRLIPGSGTYTGQIQAIFTNARAALQPYSSNDSVRAIMGYLGGAPSQTTTAQQVAADRNVLSNTISKSASDAASVLAYARGVVTGEKPPGYSDTSWFVNKWGARAGLGLLTAGIIYGIWKWERVGEKVAKVKHIAHSAVQSARSVVEE